MSRWLVTGATGLLGANAVVALRDEQVVATARRSPAVPREGFVAADIGSSYDRARLVTESGADVVLHAAALSSIEACRENPALARAINVDASVDLAGRAAQTGARFVFISTDAVFDGSRGDYTEADPVSPASEYGRTKAEGERRVLDANPDALVARVNFYGWSPSGRRSVAEFFHSRLSAGERVNGFTDVVVSTMYVVSLVEAIRHLVDAQASGIVHVVSREPTSKYDFGRRLAVAFGWDPDLVAPGTAAAELADPRGSRMSLRTDLFTSLTGRELPNQSDGIRRLREDGGPLRPRVAKLAPAEGAQ